MSDPESEKTEAEVPEPAAAKRSFEVRGTLRAGFALWRAAMGPLMWLAALGLVASVPLSALMAITGFDPLVPASYTPLTVAGLGLALILGLPFSIGSAAGSLIVLQEIAQVGEARTGTLAAFVAGYRCFWRVLGAWLVMGAAAVLAAAPAAVAWFASDPGAPERPTIAVALASIAALVIAIFWVRWTPATAVVVFEQRRPVQAILRASALTRGRFWRVLGVLAVYAAVSAVAQAVAAMVGGSAETAQILAMGIQVVLLGPLSAALGFALYMGLARSELPRA